MGKPIIASKHDGSSPLTEEMQKLHRVMRVLQLIQSQAGWNVQSLAKECEVNPRTIYRDLQMLGKAGIPLYFDEERHCYQIQRDFFMKPIELTLEESLALIVLGEQIGKDGQIPFTRAATRAVAKVRSQLPEHLRKELVPLDDQMVIRLGQVGRSEEAKDVFARVQSALARRRCLRCAYESGKGNSAKRFVLKPYRLMFDQRAWYVVGHHGTHNEVRTLKLNRFTHVEETDLSYSVPKDFSLKKHMGNAWRMIRGEKTYQIELKFDAEFAENIADTHWHDTQEIEWNEDGSITFRCRVDGLSEIQWWILARGPHCKVVAPRELADRVRELAADTAKLYA